MSSVYKDPMSASRFIFIRLWREELERPQYVSEIDILNKQAVGEELVSLERKTREVDRWCHVD